MSDDENIMEQYGAMTLLPVIIDITCILSTMQMLLAFAVEESNNFSDLVLRFSSWTLASMDFIFSRQSFASRIPSNHARFFSASR